MKNIIDEYGALIIGAIALSLFIAVAYKILIPTFSEVIEIYNTTLLG